MKRSTKIRKMFAVMMLVLLSSTVFAVSWQWKASEDGIAYFRYQVDGYEPGKWNKVDASVTTYSLPDEKSHVLYVQQSKDGTVWSDSLILDTEGVVPVISWHWTASEDGIAQFRYQVDGEDADDWTIVDASVTSYTVPDPDDAIDHVLYVQQSWDGEVWSDSLLINEQKMETMVSNTDEVAAIPMPMDLEAAGPMETVEAEPVETVAAEPLKVVVTLPEKTAAVESVVTEAIEPVETEAVEPVVTEAIEPVETEAVEPVETEAVEPVAVEPMETVEAEPIESEPTQSEKSSKEPPEQRIDVLVGGGINLDTVLAASWFHTGTYAVPDMWEWPSASIDYVRKRPASGFGLRIGLGYTLYNPTSYRYHAGDVHMLGTYTFAASSAAFEIGLGAMMMVPSANIGHRLVLPFDTSDIDIFYGPMVQMNLHVDISKHVQWILQTEARLLLRDTFIRAGLRADARMGLGFRF